MLAHAVAEGVVAVDGGNGVGGENGCSVEK